MAFKLYDTYGFPLDLTQDALKPRGISVDTKSFDAAMDKQKEEARKAWKGSGDAATEAIWFEVRDRIGATDFLGYDTEKAEGEVRALLKDGKEVESIKAGEEAALVLNQTPFYGESGGQVGDEGTIKGPKGALFRVTDTEKKLGDVIVHLGRVEKGAFKAGDAVELVVDHGRRTATRANHSATHLLHEALRQVLGDARRAEGLAGGARAPALRLLPHQADEPGRARRGGSEGQRHHPAERGRRDAADGAGRRHGVGRHGAVRRKVWR